MYNIVIFLLCFSGLAISFVIALTAILAQLEDRKKMLARIESVSLRKNNFLSDIPQKVAFKKNSASLLERKISQYLRHRAGRENSFRLKLFRSGLEGKVSRVLLLISLISGCVGYIISEFGLVDFIYVIPLGILFGCGGTYFIINFFEQRFKRKIIAALPLAIDIILRGIKSGSSIERTFKIIVNEVAPPLRDEFAKILQQIDFGISFDEALNQAADRLDLADFYFFCCALIIQRRAGGSLSEILENISFSLSRTNEIRGKIKTLSAEAKVTGYILGAVPPIIWMGMIYINPSYLSFFKDTQQGHNLLMYVCGLIFMAFMSIRQMIRIKI